MNWKLSGLYLGMVLVVLGIFEGLSFVGGKVLQRKWGMWSVPQPPTTRKIPVSYDQYLQRRDPVLGWPYPDQYGVDLAPNGAQPSLHFPDGPHGPSCVSLYGDSFTEGVGDTSGPDKIWSNIVAAKLGCYVANFGMGGYGTDQAYLRFERKPSDDAPVVVLGVHTENVMRNLGRIRDLQNYQSWFALKPRFVVNEQRDLALVAIPDLTKEQYLRAIGAVNPLLVLDHENFQPGGAAGAVALEFPFTVSVVRNLVHFHALHARLRNRPEWLTFLQEDHPLNGLAITVGITEKFVDVAKLRGKVPLVVVFPHPMDFKYFIATGVWTYQGLVDAYARESIPFIDFGPYLIAAWRARGGSIDAYFGASSHYSDEGSALVASFVLQRLQELAPAPGGQ